TWTPPGCDHAVRLGKVIRVESGFLAVHLKSLSAEAANERTTPCPRTRREYGLVSRKTHRSDRDQDRGHRRAQADVRAHGAACDHHRKTHSTPGIACSAAREHKGWLVYRFRPAHRLRSGVHAEGQRSQLRVCAGHARENFSKSDYR